jgi:hypothetical protein
VGADKNLWFTLAGSRVRRGITDGIITLYKDPLWFAQPGSIGRVTAQGKFRHFVVAGPNAQLQGIVTGPAIGRLTTSGTYTEFLELKHTSRQASQSLPPANATVPSLES